MTNTHQPSTWRQSPCPQKRGRERNTIDTLNTDDILYPRGFAMRCRLLLLTRRTVKESWLAAQDRTKMVTCVLMCLCHAYFTTFAISISYRCMAFTRSAECEMRSTDCITGYTHAVGLYECGRPMFSSRERFTTHA